MEFDLRFTNNNCPCKVNGLCNQLGSKDGGYTFDESIPCAEDVCPWKSDVNINDLIMDNNRLRLEVKILQEKVYEQDLIISEN